MPLHTNTHFSTVGRACWGRVYASLSWGGVRERRGARLTTASDRLVSALPHTSHSHAHLRPPPSPPPPPLPPALPLLPPPPHRPPPLLLLLPSNPPLLPSDCYHYHYYHRQNHCHLHATFASTTTIDTNCIISFTFYVTPKLISWPLKLLTSSLPLKSPAPQYFFHHHQQNIMTFYVNAFTTKLATTLF